MSKLRKRYEYVRHGTSKDVVDFLQEAVPLLVTVADAVLEKRAAEAEVAMCYRHQTRISTGHMTRALRRADAAQSAYEEALHYLEMYMDGLSERNDAAS